MCCPSSDHRCYLFTFLTSLQRLIGIQRNLIESSISSPLPSLCFGLIGKLRWLPWPLNSRDILDFFSMTSDRNSTKMKRKQDLNICVVLVDQKTKMTALTSEWLRNFPLLLFNCCTYRIQRNSTCSKVSSSSSKFVLFGPIGKPRWPP